MAEAQTNDSNSTGTTQRFFCHQCKDSIYPDLPDYKCPQCQTGFIEEITEDDDPAAVEPASHFAHVWQRTLLDNLRDDIAGANSPGSQRPPNSMNRFRFVPRPLGSPGVSGLSPPLGGGYGQEGAGVEFLINHLLQTLTTGGLFPGEPLPLNLIHLHGNPGDYAWGADGLDSIVTQLLNQLEGSGPPPASREQMDNLPIQTITEADVAKTLQCSVCMEDYKKGEEVRLLPCNHLYHADCIFPWLERHGSCPVCRKDLNGEDTSTRDDDVTLPGDVTRANGFEDRDECE